MPMEVVIVAHDSAWTDMFHSESQLILTAFRQNAIAAHHIGSTAITAIVAKPVIDMLVVAADIKAVDGHNVEMETIGYEAMGEFGIPFRRYFRKDNDAGVRTHHVHVFEQGNEQISRHLGFRDFMNAHPDWATRYSDLKLDLAAKYPNAMNLYIEGKDSFIKHVDQLAAAWRQGANGEPTVAPKPPSVRF